MTENQTKTIICRNPHCKKEVVVPVGMRGKPQEYCSPACRPAPHRKPYLNKTKLQQMEEDPPKVVTLADVTHPGWLALVDTLLDDLLEEQTVEVTRLMSEAPGSWQCECGRRAPQGYQCRCGLSEETNEEKTDE